MRWFIWMGFAGATLGMGCNSGCSGSQQGTPPLAAGANEHRTASGSTSASAAHTNATPAPRSDAERQALAAPAHRFRPQPIAPRSRPAPAPAPNPYALPAFVDGSARCFTHPTPYSYPAPAQKSTSGGGIGYGSGSGRLGGSHSSPRPTSAAKPSRAAAESRAAEGAPAPAAPAPAAPPAGQSKGETARAPSPVPTSPPRPSVDRALEEGASPAERGRADDYAPEPIARSEGFGAAIYLSNDDTMSLSSAQRVIWAIDHFQPVQQSHVRPHELLNYFSFETAPVPPNRDFSVVANIAPSATDPSISSLALAVKGRAVTTATRRNVNLAYAVDRSGSMAADGRMDYLKRGLLRSLRELKNGDIVHISLFDTTACNLAQNFVVGRDPMQRLEQLISRIEPLGSTNLYDGLTQAYHSADVAYQPAYSNRVVLITDALANQGVTDEVLIGTVGKSYDGRRIRLSGVGVGHEFNDALLDRLTERGRGAYVFLGSEAEVDAVFGTRFVSLIETVANDVHFKLSLPPSLAMNVFYGEEASTEKSRVQAIHYFANTSQLFLSDLKTRDGFLHYQDDLMLSIEYEDPETQSKMVEEYAFNIGQILGESRNLKKAQLLTRFIRELGAMAERPLPSRYGYSAAAWYDDDAYGRCSAVRGELASLASGLEGDPEVRRVQGLWDTFCSRYAVPQYAPPPPPPPRPPQPPVYRPQPTPYPYPQPPQNDYPPPERNNDYAPPDGWPSAQR